MKIDAPGGAASLTVSATAGESCALRYTTPAGTVSTAAGLGAQIVGANGRVTWTWKLGTRTQAGTGHAVVTCPSGVLASEIPIS